MPGNISPTSKSVVRLAVIDDDKTLLSVFYELLRNSGYHAHFFSKPAVALSEITAVKGHYHLVMTDFNMPLMNGLEFARKLRESEPELPIIFMSGEVFSDEVVDELHRLGRVTLLNKPFGLEETLKELIPKALRGGDLKKP